MRFARIVFTVAGVWGIAVLMPLYFLVDVTGRRYAVPADYPGFFYGFLSVALAWQIAFLAIGSNPAWSSAVVSERRVKKRTCWPSGSKWRSKLASARAAPATRLW